MKMKLNALTLAVAAGFVGSAAQAADVALFPYVVNSATVTTIVSIVDQGAAGAGYNADGSTGGSRLHWRLNYKAGENASNNTARCEEVDYYLPSSTNDIQTVDLGGKFGSATKGVLFSDASVNNNWNAGTTASINYMLGAAAAGAGAQRGALFVHNADQDAGVAGQTLYGEAMVLDFSTGAAWGYQAALSDNGAANDNTAFNFIPAATGTTSGVLTFMPLAETTTRVFVTPVNPLAANPMLAANGASVAGWDQLNTLVGMQTSTGVAFDRDENLVSGTALSNVVCVGAVDATSMMTAGAASVLANGGWGRLTTAAGTTSGMTPTTRAVLTKLEYNTAGKFNGQAIPGTFNNGFILR
jgi:hypothetical protein